MRAGQAVIELLKIEQVRHVFGIVGSTFLDVLDVLYDDKSVEYINVRHEQGAAFMADGLARVSGLPAACLVTAGPGATNLITGIAAAYVGHRSEEHTSELQSHSDLVCRLLLEKKKKKNRTN